MADNSEAKRALENLWKSYDAQMVKLATELNRYYNRPEMKCAMKMAAEYQKKMDRVSTTYGPMFENLEKNLEMFQKQIGLALAPTLKNLALFQQRMGPVLVSYAKNTDLLQRQIGVVFQPYLKYMAQIGEMIRNLPPGKDPLVSLFDQFAIIMLRLDWPPLMEISIVAIRKIVGIHKNKSLDEARNEIEELIFSTYDEKELSRLLSRWKKQKWLSKRLPALKEIVETHNDGKYWVSIPTMLPQIEGIIAERYGHRKKIDYEKLRKYLKKCMAADKEYPISSCMDRQAQDFFETIVLATFNEWLKPPQSCLSRHSIMHGHDTSYGTKANSLRAILLFNYFQGRLRRLVSIGNGKHFHCVGCYYVDIERTDLIYYEDEKAAIQTGKMPCKKCFEID